MTKAGRLEEKGHDLCRALVVLLTEDEALPTPAGVGYAMVAVAVAWGLASPVIYGGRLLDRLLACDPTGIDAGTFSFEEPAAQDEPDPEDLTVVVDI